MARKINSFTKLKNGADLTRFLIYFVFNFRLWCYRHKKIFMFHFPYTSKLAYYDFKIDELQNLFWFLHIIQDQLILMYCFYVLFFVAVTSAWYALRWWCYTRIDTRSAKQKYTKFPLNSMKHIRVYQCHNIRKIIH